MPLLEAATTGGGLFGLSKLLGENPALNEIYNLPQRGKQLAKGFGKAFPSILNTTAGIEDRILPSDQVLLQSVMQSFPQLAGLQRAESLKDQDANLGLFREDVETQLGYDQALNKGIYERLQPQILSGLSDLLQPGLTGGERAEIDRFQNKESTRLGTQFAPSFSDTVAKATTFGNAARDRFQSGLATATNAIPYLKRQIPGPIRQIGSLGIQQPQAGQFAQNYFGQAGNTLSNLGGVQQAAVQGRIQAPSQTERVAGLLPDY